MSREPDPPMPRWTTKTRARVILGCSKRLINELIRDGNLTCRELPGYGLRLRLDEVEALARRSTRPAQAGAQ